MSTWSERRRLGRKESVGARSVQFLRDVLPAEIEAINARRQADREAGRNRRESLKPPELDEHDNEVDEKILKAVGLALSGGGVRSAAFSLGVLQALNQRDVLKNVDYLSTVSGGGYIGSSLSATLTQSEGRFVFGSPPAPGKTSAAHIEDTDEVEHVRNYSNYLIPRGLRDILTSIAIVLRGLVANLGLVLPVILIGAAITVAANPNRESLSLPSLPGLGNLEFLPSREFGITLVVVLIVLAAFFVWALGRSSRLLGAGPEYRTLLPTMGAWIITLLAIILFLEFQPFVVAAMFRAADGGAEGGLISDVVATWVQRLAAVTAPIAAVVAFFSKQLGDTISAGTAGSKMSVLTAGIAARAAVFAAAAALPLIIWVGYLYLSYWGVSNDRPLSVAEACEQAPGSADFSLNITAGEFTGAFGGVFEAPSAEPCPPEKRDAKKKTGKKPDPLGHRPTWLTRLVGIVNEAVLGNPAKEPPAEDTDGSDKQKKPPIPSDIVVLYSGTGVLIFLLALFLRPNANSLHRLYRDRLSKAFLFDPGKRDPRKSGMTWAREFRPLSSKISALANEYAPYHLINAALNVHASDFANRRGRNADFFLFSPHYTGSEATGYVQTKLYEAKPSDLDLGTALAISGAAFSSNMGAKSVRVLAPTLALLNVRLGYWLKNPDFIRFVRNAQRKETGEGGKFSGKKRPWSSRDPRGAPLYIWREMTGRLHENSKVVYVTDGGHIENLGVYELLRRRCKLIIAVDAEADPDLTFPSFVTLQRYARIDLGVRLRMPWGAIQKKTKAWMGSGSGAGRVNGDDAPKPSQGPHVAVGEIDYGSGCEKGYIVYVKSSLTGDENDYIRDYARRHPRYPHETTGDQFFSEEQFEVYRALGFHAMRGFLHGADEPAVADRVKTRLNEIRTMLGL